MEKIICACGHSNPYGTKLCEKCGRPLTEEEKQNKVVDMRYDGTAIRSKTYNKSIVDKIWNFFSSVKVGISLIIITLIAASIGTLLPQEFYVKASDMEKGAYYADVYGTFGKIYYTLGLSDLYSSWWFQILVGMLAVSIIVASLDRGIPLYKSLKNQRVKRHESFMKRQRIFGEGQITADAEETLDKVAQKMTEMRYSVRRDGSALLAEKGRFSRYGPYINHVGLIIFISGVMLRLVPGFYVDESIWVREGETRAITGMDGYFIENRDFILETHDNEPQGEQVKQNVNVVAKNFQTDITLYKQPKDAIPGDTENLEKVKDYSIRVNHPLKEDGYALYQMDYRLNELKQMNFELINKASEKSLGKVEIDLTNPKKEYDLGNGSSVQILVYTPDFDGFENGEPQTKTSIPNNPAFLFKMTTPETPEGEVSFVEIMQPPLEPLGENQYRMKFAAAEMRDMSGITVRKDSTIPILFVGGVIFMIGVVIGSYWNHRRLWLQVEPDGRVLMAAHVNKNMFSMKKDLDAVTAFAALPSYKDQLEKEEADEESTDGGIKEKEGDNTL
ncbi:cytochrome c biogenesis protein ResB [Lysinibacillus sp. FSL M8-0216]|uniref:Cytochrome c biogenesis protein n=1 Tax=Lysinibacillus fusiformis TaxID=28031 RepID=A0A1H9CMV3_9BACI|nr:MULTISPECIES: cytochrome c biogenesis protein ResB [Lysinibacillus]HAU34831.1 cytochrome C biogenesis protein [Lysinibacillus sp.]MCG7437116.1 cytochrome c biogenesis protein ResB [Lysinibacillus fusiformis]MED4078229.1 cytochrome c biogenesis protein ResB [Lysinibacillus fusiformis]MED4668831.1 cytochrome c biogenesis protein ResB [Lysinibacillus fusiformis]NOG27360.1 cytochrome C biogenesis protein [Lysinibacillus fusiformis]